MSYPPPPPPPPGGAAGQPSYGGAPQDHPQGTTILVLGILGLVCCGPLGIAAWVMGNNAIREIDASGQPFANRGQVNAGRICGIIATVLMILGIVIYGVLFATGALTTDDF